MRRLVDAITQATDHDEADWVEWKSSLDLTTKDGCFAIARTVLGMANRMPERACQLCEGVGYIVIGAEPGRRHGIASVDPAVFEPLIESYVGGADGPRWLPTYVVDDGKSVLVVTVEGPRPGDRIFTLRKEFGSHRSGTVFVRKQGRTVPANAEEMDALQRRLTAVGKAGGASLDVRAAGDIPLSWLASATTRPDIEAWADRQRDQLIQHARAVERRKLTPVDETEPDLTGLGGLKASLAAMAQQNRRALEHSGGLRGFVEKEDSRSLDSYIKQVDEWRDRLVGEALEALTSAYTAQGHGVVTLVVENLGSRFLPDVEVEARFDYDTAHAEDEQPDKVRLPAPPRKYGTPAPSAEFFPRILTPAMPYLGDVGRVSRRTWVEDGSIVVRFHIGDLRQHATDTSDEVYVFLTERPDDGVLHGTWKATVRDLDGVLTGAIDVPVRTEAVDVVKLLVAATKS